MVLLDKILKINLLLAMISTATSHAEMLPTLCIAELVNKSEQIVLAKFYKLQDDEFWFVSKQFDSELGYTDTIAVANMGLYSFHKERLQNADEIVIFIEDRSDDVVTAVLSGYRLIVDGKIFQPVQGPGFSQYVFVPIKEQIDRQELLYRIELMQLKVDSLMRIGDIQDDSLRNQRIFQWIQDHPEIMSHNSYGYNDIREWGDLIYQAFDWIEESRIYQDVWKAKILLLEIRSNVMSLNERYPEFSNSEFREFLLATALNDTLEIWKRKLAFRYLRDNAVFWQPMDGHNPRLILAPAGTDEQNRMLAELAPMVVDEQFKYDAFYAIRNISDPGSLFPHRINLSQLPLIVDSFKSETSPPLKYEMRKFILRHVDEDGWKKITGSDGKISMVIQGLEVDTNLNVIRFNLGGSLNREIINEFPVIVFQKIKGFEVIESKDHIYLSDFKLPYSEWQRDQVLTISTVDLSRGKWRVSAHGTAGQNNHLYWQTEFIEFVK